MSFQDIDLIVPYIIKHPWFFAALLAVLMIVTKPWRGKAKASAKGPRGKAQKHGSGHFYGQSPHRQELEEERIEPPPVVPTQDEM
jgi:hypothetical protein